jgi:outer membrane protein assembly factor BamA
LLLGGLLAVSLLAQAPPTSDALDGKIVEQITVQGLHKVKESNVLSQMMSQVGEPYSADNVAIDRERLDRMLLFSKIEIESHAGSNGVLL